MIELEHAPKAHRAVMRPLTPTDVAKSLLWIREAQEHINSCADDFDDTESLAAAQELQAFVDREWDALGSLVSHCAKPYSVLLDRGP